MEKITCEKDLAGLKNNKILGTFPEMDKSAIRFQGVNNVLFCEEHVCLKNSNINFKGDNSLVYLGKSNRHYCVHIVVFNNSVCHIGRNNSFTDKITLLLSEQKHIFIGDDNMFSRGIWFRIADPHLIYSAENFTRKNPSRSIFIGDHVWVAQDAMILKGSRIASGSIIGAMSLVSGKTVPSNVSFAGNPSKLISKNVFWDRTSAHDFTDSETAKYSVMKTDKFIFSYDENEYISPESIDEAFSRKITAEEKLSFIQQMKHSKNRFSL